MNSHYRFYSRTLSTFAFCILMAISFEANGKTDETSSTTSVSNTHIIYVKKSVSSSGNGKSWASPFKYLREALDAAPTFVGSFINGMLITDVEIWMARGTYYPDEPVSMTIMDNDRSLSFTMLNNVQIYGGFAGTETALSQRNWSSNKTYLSGDIDQNDYLDDFTGNSYQVVENFYASNNILNNSAVLDGVIIRGGYANGPSHKTIGAGLFNYYASPKIRNCIIKENHADKWGGATFTQQGTPKYINCLIYKNTSLDHGAVAYNNNGDPEFQNCTITQNTSLDSSTSIYNNSTGVSNIFNTILWNNGKEIFNNGASTTVVNSSIIQGGYPGAIDDDPRFDNPYAEDFYLSNCSPAIGSGNNSLNSSLLDIAGTNRVINTTIDIGAYEHTVGNIANPSTIYVDRDAAGSKDGTDWPNAFLSLQDGLNDARMSGGCIQIWVAEGAYYPDDGNGYTNNAQDSSFMMLNEVEIYGGFLGTESDLSDRNWYVNETILSGDIDQDGDTTDNAYHIIKNTATSSDPMTSSAVLDGFTITAGNAIGDGFGQGGGIFNRNYCSPMIRNSTIKYNYAFYGGGASDSKSAIYTNCVFYKNAASYGGAVSDGYGFFVNCSFSQNTALERGGAGIFNSAFAFPTFINSILWDNWATHEKELYSQEGPPKLINCIIEGGFNGYNSKNNIDVDPKFLDILSGDLRLSACSPAIDAGLNCYNTSSIDLANNERVAYDLVDIGAFEHQTSSTLNIIYVDSSKTGTTGNNWGDAYAHLQDALNEAESHDGCTQIWVAEGTYYPDDGFGQSNNEPSSSFKLINNVEMYGGFIGTEDSLYKRNWNINATVLSGDIDQDNTSSNNADRVVGDLTSFKIFNSSILDGFSITHGIGVAGSGILLLDDSPIIRNCFINNNHTTNIGGAMYLFGSNPLILNCIFENNSAQRSGGGLYILGTSNVRLMNSMFRVNSAETEGGGAMRINGASKVEVINCSFYENNSLDGGGAFFLANSGSTTITNCSFNSNFATVAGGAIYSANINAIIANSIFYGNNTEIEFSSPLSEPLVSNSIVEGGFVSGNNILDMDPKFADTLTGDLSLTACSPAIDIGDNSPRNSSFDVIGNPRRFKASESGPTTIDLGAYEYQQLNTGCCLDNLTLSGTITSGTYEAAISIMCDGVIGAGADVILNAPEINLTEDFEVEDMGLLETQTEGCSN